MWVPQPPSVLPGAAFGPLFLFKETLVSSQTGAGRGQAASMGTCVRMTSSGSAYGRFRRALDNDNLLAARAAAIELKHVGLAEALELTLLILAKEPASSEPPRSAGTPATAVTTRSPSRKRPLCSAYSRCSKADARRRRPRLLRVCVKAARSCRRPKLSFVGRGNLREQARSARRHSLTGLEGAWIARWSRGRKCYAALRRFGRRGEASSHPALTCWHGRLASEHMESRAPGRVAAGRKRKPLAARPATARCDGLRHQRVYGRGDRG